MSTSKLLSGTLLIGVGIASGNATVLATAGGVGVNWVSEAVPGLWSSLTRPLAAAYAAAIRQAIKELQADYLRSRDGRADGAAFALVAACADNIAGTEFSPGVVDVNAVQQQLNGALAQLLHGHDQRQLAFLQERLLPACAHHFQSQLLQNEAAWRAFHGLILQTLAANSASLSSQIEGFARLLAAWSDPGRAWQGLQTALTQLAAATARIEAQGNDTHKGVKRIEAKIDELARSPAPAATDRTLTFNNQGMQVGGTVQQGERQYIYAAHAEGGGTASVTNTIGAATPWAGRSAVAPAPPPTLLLLAANPLATVRLRLDQEARTVDEALRLTKHRDRFQLAQQWAVRTGDLLDALLRHRPQIVHFSGHGSPDGRLIFENQAGEPVAVAAAALDHLFAGVRGIRCVLLNACWSQRHVNVLAKNVDAVVGMAHQISDTAAIHFVAGFYRTLGDGGSVQQAFDLGRAQLLAATGDQPLSEAQTPRLRTRRGVMADQIRFV